MRKWALTVMVKPHVDVADGTFRGQIQPASPRSWFESYGEMINRYADLAQRAGAELFCVGTELTTMAECTDDFRGVIDGVRSRFDGELTYGANLVDEAERVEFWDDLDLIGIDAYMPLSTPDAEPSVEWNGAAGGGIDVPGIDLPEIDLPS